MPRSSTCKQPSNDRKEAQKKKKEKKGKGKKCDERVILKEVANGTGKIRKIARKN